MKINGRNYTIRTPIAEIINEYSIQNMLCKAYAQKFNAEQQRILEQDPDAMFRPYGPGLSYIYDVCTSAERYRSLLRYLLEDIRKAEKFVGKLEIYPGATYIHGYLGYDEESSMLKLDDVKPDAEGFWYGYSGDRMNLHEAMENHGMFVLENGQSCEDEYETFFGVRQVLPGINLRILFTSEECTYEEALIAMDVAMYGGDLGMVVKYEGYSEYSIQDIFLSELSIGGHDLLTELVAHRGQYMHMILETATKEEEE